MSVVRELRRMSRVVLLCLVMVGVLAVEELLEKPEVPQVEGKTNSTLEHQMWKKCFQKSSYGCIKHALKRMVNYLQQSGVQIAPGITLQTNNSADLVGVLRVLVGMEPPGSKEVHVLPKLKEFLNRLTVKVELEDPGLLKKVQTLSEEVVDGLVTTGEFEGRKKGGGGALLWSAGALAAVGFASLAAVAGKAMMASVMALMLAGLTAMRGNGGGGGGGGHKSPHVEIIKSPAHFELPPTHYEAGSHAFEHDHYYAPGYEYGREMGSRSSENLPTPTP